MRYAQSVPFPQDGKIIATTGFRTASADAVAGPHEREFPWLQMLR
jgi:hypothetical protein